jgi:hypothetical protein
MKQNLLLWLSILVSPVAWFLCLNANFALAPGTCAPSWKLARYVVFLVGLTVTAIAGGVARGQWQKLGGSQFEDENSQFARPRALALGGMLLSAMFFLTILAQAIPETMLAGCE